MLHTQLRHPVQADILEASVEPERPDDAKGRFVEGYETPPAQMDAAEKGPSPSLTTQVGRCQTGGQA
jgi:hypothetical protein